MFYLVLFYSCSDVEMSHLNSNDSLDTNFVLLLGLGVWGLKL
jgi:hypothetical protein